MDLILPPSKIEMLVGEHGKTLKTIAENPGLIGLSEMEYCGLEIPFRSRLGEGVVDIMIYAREQKIIIEYKRSKTNRTKAINQLLKAKDGMTSSAH